MIQGNHRHRAAPFRKALFLSAIFSIFMATARAQKVFSLQILDAKTGKPVVNNHVLVFSGADAQSVKDHKGSHEATTDGNGLASLSLAEDSQFLQVWVDWHSLCHSDPNSETISIVNLASQGVAFNTCSKNVFPNQPGRLTIAVRPETFWEKMNH
jgi:hypothetical protein